MHSRLGQLGGMAAVLLGAACLAPGAGCIWPGLAHPTLDVRITGAGGQTAAAQRFIVLQYWAEANDKVEPLRALIMTTAQQSLTYPVRLYPVLWTPALGIQHMLPHPAVAVFTENRQAALEEEHFRGDLAPEPGPYQVEVQLTSTRVAPEPNDPGYGWCVIPSHVVALAARVQDVDRVLRAARELTPADRELVFRQLANEAAFWRDHGPRYMYVKRDQLAKAAEIFEQRAGRTKLDRTTESNG